MYKKGNYYEPILYRYNDQRKEPEETYQFTEDLLKRRTEREEGIQ